MQQSPWRTSQPWEEAEDRAAQHMQWLGYEDAQRVPAGPDGGVDVVSVRARAQVKWRLGNTPRGDVQKLVGAARQGYDLLFFSRGYTKHALEFADAEGVALFEFDAGGLIVAVNPSASDMVARQPGVKAAADRRREAAEREAAERRAADAREESLRRSAQERAAHEQRAARQRLDAARRQAQAREAAEQQRRVDVAAARAEEVRAARERERQDLQRQREARKLSARIRRSFVRAQKHGPRTGNEAAFGVGSAARVAGSGAARGTSVGARSIWRLWSQVYPWLALLVACFFTAALVGLILNAVGAQEDTGAVVAGTTIGSIVSAGCAALGFWLFRRGRRNLTFKTRGSENKPDAPSDTAGKQAKPPKRRG